jgi:NADH:ubiquinone oxidoreductase subunit 3 (subunit A)
MSLSAYVPILALFALAAAFTRLRGLSQLVDRSATTGPSWMPTNADRTVTSRSGWRFSQVHLTAMLFIVFDIPDHLPVSWAVSSQLLAVSASSPSWR